MALPFGFVVSVVFLIGKWVADGEILAYRSLGGDGSCFALGSYALRYADFCNKYLFVLGVVPGQPFEIRSAQKRNPLDSNEPIA